MTEQLVAKSTALQGTIQIIFVGIQKGDAEYCAYAAPIMMTAHSVRVALQSNYKSDT